MSVSLNAHRATNPRVLLFAGDLLSGQKRREIEGRKAKEGGLFVLCRCRYTRTAAFAGAGGTTMSREDLWNGHFVSLRFTRHDGPLDARFPRNVNPKFVPFHHLIVNGKSPRRPSIIERYRQPHGAACNRLKLFHTFASLQFSDRSAQ